MTQPEGQTARDVFPEDDGIPEVSQDDSPTQERAEDPQFEPMPGEQAAEMLAQRGEQEPDAPRTAATG